MKKLFFAAAILLGFASIAFSQKVIDKKIDVDGQKTIMKLSFADDIVVEAWNNNYIEFQATVSIDSNKYNDFYTLNIKQESEKVEIVEEVDFKSIQEKMGKKNHYNFQTDINYKVKVPRNMDFKIETISGEVELIGCEGEMAINSVSGYIDYSIPEKHQAKIDLSTVTGDVYSNVKFDNPVSSTISWGGTNRELTLNGGRKGVKLKTVSGDIFLRKL